MLCLVFARPTQTYTNVFTHAESCYSSLYSTSHIRSCAGGLTFTTTPTPRRSTTSSTANTGTVSFEGTGTCVRKSSNTPAHCRRPLVLYMFVCLYVIQLLYLHGEPLLVVLLTVQVGGRCVDFCVRTCKFVEIS